MKITQPHSALIFLVAWFNKNLYFCEAKKISMVSEKKFDDTFSVATMFKNIL